MTRIIKDAWLLRRELFCALFITVFVLWVAAPSRSPTVATTATLRNQGEVYAFSHTPDNRLLGKLVGANFNSTADQAITIQSGNYIIRSVTATNASASLTLAVGGLYTATAKGGTAVVAATQVYTALTGTGKILDLTIAVPDRRTERTLYLSLTTAQGTAATADVYIWGDRLDAQ